MLSREEVETGLGRFKADDGHFYCPGVDDAHALGEQRMNVGSDGVPRCQGEDPCDPVSIMILAGFMVADIHRLMAPEETTEPALQRREFDDDTDNAMLFSQLYGRELRWVPTRKTWLVFVGTHWKEDQGGAARRRGMATARSLWGRAREEQDPERAARLMKRAQSSGQRSRIEAMIELGKALMEVGEEELDSDPWALNVLNGTLDLRTGHLRSHCWNDMLTRVAPVEWDPGATSERWDQFLETSIPDPDERDFLQRLAGYCLTGVATEEKFFFVHGPAGSGKSTFVDALAATLGHYSANADPSLFLKSQRPTEANRANPALVHLVGRRLAVSTEPPKGQSWDEGLMKRLTGGDAMTTRQNYGATFEFTPQFTLLVVGNSRPPVEDDAGGAMTRRLVEVPFPVPVGERRDDSLKTELRDPARSGAAILRWAVEGCLEWQCAGLRIPETVEQATSDYWAEQAENDPVHSFLEEHYERETDALVPFSQVHQHFLTATSQSLSAKTLARRIRDLGVEERKSNGVRCWVGLRQVRIAPVPARTINWSDALAGAVPQSSGSLGPQKGP